jgi:hypothetical protein
MDQVKVVRKYMDPILSGAIEKRRVSKFESAGTGTDEKDRESFLEHLLDHTSGIQPSSILERLYMADK